MFLFLLLHHLRGPKDSRFSHEKAQGVVNVYHQFLLLTSVLLVQGGRKPTGRGISVEVFPCFAGSPSNLHCGCLKCSCLGIRKQEDSSISSGAAPRPPSALLWILAVYEPSPRGPCCKVWFSSLHKQWGFPSSEVTLQVSKALTQKLTSCHRTALSGSALTFPKLLHTPGLLWSGEPCAKGRAIGANPISQMRRLRFGQSLNTRIKHQLRH